MGREVEWEQVRARTHILLKICTSVIMAMDGFKRLKDWVELANREKYNC
jgi:hypothetical protein